MEPLVERPGLLRAMDRRGVRLVLVVGPPGSGKTALLRQWLDSLPEARHAVVVATREPPSRFWEAVVDALGLAGEPVGAAIQMALDQGAGGEAVVGPLVQHFATVTGPAVVLALEDYQEVSDDVHRPLTRMIERCPPALRIALATRHDPPLPIGRWRVRGELAEVRDADLSFDPSEVAAMFGGFGDRVVDAVAERTEGWAAGLQLAALAAGRSTDPVACLETLDGCEPSIAEFLVQEALDSQPPELRDFLLATAVLESFDASLCDAVTGRLDGAANIARLASRHAFIVPVDRPGRWFRYHRLFADVLREEERRRHPERKAPARQRAAVWHAARGEAQEAIEYALSAGDHDLALDQLTAHHFHLSAQGKWPLVLSWLNRIPASALARHPARALDYALVLAGSGRVAQAAAVAARVEAQFNGDTPRHLRATVAAVRATEAAVHGDHDAFLRQAPAVDALLTDDHPAAAPWALLRAWMLGLVGDFAHSRAAFADAAIPGRTGPEDLATLGTGLRAEVLGLQGSLREAAVAVASVLTAWAGADPVYPPALGSALRAQAMLHLEAGRLDEAERALELTLAADERAPLPVVRILTAVLLGEVARARGRPEEALDRIQDAWRPRDTRPLGRLLRTYVAEARVRAELDLAEVGDAARSARDAALPAVAALLRARVALAGGDRSGAHLHLNRVGRELGTGWWRRQVEAHLLRARSYLESNPAGARHEVKKALELGAPEGLMRTFAQETELAPLYADVTGGRPLPGLGALVTGRVSAARQVVIDLVEEPSERELQVLALLAQDLSYQEVASVLFLSRNTVKAHAQSVYRKVGAHSRAEATEQARRMGLVAPVHRDLTPPG